MSPDARWIGHDPRAILDFTCAGDCVNCAARCPADAQPRLAKTALFARPRWPLPLNEQTNNPFMKKSLFWLCLAAVTVLSLLPTGYLPPPVFSLWDKAQHALGFVVLSVLGLSAYPQHARTLPILLLVCGGAIELAQAGTGWRYGEWLDLLADGVGVLCGAALWLALRGRIPHAA